MSTFALFVENAEPKARSLIARNRRGLINVESEANALYAGRRQFQLAANSVARADLQANAERAERIASTLRAVLAAQSPALRAAE